MKLASSSVMSVVNKAQIVVRPDTNDDVAVDDGNCKLEGAVSLVDVGRVGNKRRFQRSQKSFVPKKSWVFLSVANIFILANELVKEQISDFGDSTVVRFSTKFVSMSKIHQKSPEEANSAEGKLVDTTSRHEEHFVFHKQSLT